MICECRICEKIKDLESGNVLVKVQFNDWGLKKGKSWHRPVRTVVTKKTFNLWGMFVSRNIKFSVEGKDEAGNPTLSIHGLRPKTKSFKKAEVDIEAL